MALEGYWVTPVTFDSVRPFLKQWHYSPYQNVQAKYSFGLFRENDMGFPEMIGVMVYTPPAGVTAGAKYLPEDPTNCIELRRLCCIDDTPKNAESYFIGATLRWLKKHTTTKLILSYADPEEGHEGTIYKASNFEYIGLTAPGSYLMVDGEKFHTRTLTMIDRPYGREIQERYKNNDPNIFLVKTKPKHIYVYKLR